MRRRNPASRGAAAPAFTSKLPPAPLEAPLSVATVVELLSEERLFAARKVLLHLEQNDPAAVRSAVATDATGVVGAKLQRVRARAAAAQKALEEFRSDECNRADGGGGAAALAGAETGVPRWQLSQELFGITTHYRTGGTPLPGGGTDGPPGSLWIKVRTASLPRIIPAGYPGSLVAHLQTLTSSRIAALSVALTYFVRLPSSVSSNSSPRGRLSVSFRRRSRCWCVSGLGAPLTASSFSLEVTHQLISTRLLDMPD